MTNTSDEMVSQLAEIFPSIPDFSFTDRAPNPENQSDDNPKQPLLKFRCYCKQNYTSTTMIQCDSCKYWLHSSCVRIKNMKHINPFICLYCQFNIASSVKPLVSSQSIKCQNAIEQHLNQMKCERNSITPIVAQLEQMVNDIDNAFRLIPQFLPQPDTNAKSPKPEILSM